MIVGNLDQLSPVSDRLLFWTEPRQAASRRYIMQTACLAAYLAISGSITLDVIMRQVSLDRETKPFKSALGRHRSSMQTVADFELLENRFFTELESADQRTSDNALYLSISRGSVHMANSTDLLNAAKPVLRISARNTGVNSDRANDDQAEGLANHVYMKKAATVMIDRNLWTVHGTMGTVHAPFWRKAEVAETLCPV